MWFWVMAPIRSLTSSSARATISFSRGVMTSLMASPLTLAWLRWQLRMISLSVTMPWTLFWPVQDHQGADIFLVHDLQGIADDGVDVDRKHFFALVFQDFFNFHAYLLGVILRST